MAKDRPLPSAARLAAAVLGLRPLEREVLWLAAGEHLTNDAIARRLGITVAQAKRLLAGALRELDRAIDRFDRS